MVSLYGILNFPPKRIIFENQRIVLTCKNIWKFNEVNKTCIFTAFLYIPNNTCFFLFLFFFLNKYATFEESCHLESMMPNHMPFKILRYII